MRSTLSEQGYDGYGHFYLLSRFTIRCLPR